MKHYILHRLVKLHRFINLLVIINAIVFAISILVFLVFKSQADNNSREIKRIYYLNRQVVQITALKRNADEEFSVYKLSKDAATQQRLNDLHEKISYSIESLPDITLKTREQQQNIEDLLGFENARQQVVKNFQFHNKADELQRDSAIYVQSAQNIDELLAKINDVENVLIDQLKAKETEWETFNGKILTIVVALGAFLLVLLALKINNDLYLRRKAEDKIRKSEARYKSLMENAGSVMYTTDIKGVITYASAKAADLTGYTNEQLIGKHFSFLLSPSDIAKLVDIYANQVRQNIKETVRELVIITQDGTTKWVEQVAILMKEGNHVIGFQCIVRDISDKKQMELELQKSAQNLKKSQYYLQAILDNTTSLMYIKDVSGRFVMANKRYKDLFGLADEQIINKTNYDFMSKEEADFYKKLDDEVIATKKP
ncbi:MAG: PAS domain-containing protein, partial [Chitinophagaceae bacterium]